MFLTLGMLLPNADFGLLRNHDSNVATGANRWPKNYAERGYCEVETERAEQQSDGIAIERTGRKQAE